MKAPIIAAALLLAEDASAQESKPRSVASPAMQKWAPDLAEDTDRLLFGDIWLRPQLQPRDRSLVTLSALVATGCTPQLSGHLGRALDNGVRPAEIAGLITHLAYYTGWPNAFSALEVVDRVFTERGFAPSAVSRASRTNPLPASDGARREGVERTVGPTAANLAELTNEKLFADLWRRSDLRARDRSLITIAALAANGDSEQLTFHLRRGEDKGLRREEQAEAVMHLAFYAGWPKAMAAVGVLSQSTSGPDDGSNTQAPVQVITGGSGPALGPASRFTGRVTTDTAFRGTGSSLISGSRVTFAAGARSNWHRHPRGQLLIVTEGEGLVQEENGPVRRIRAGDAVWTASGVKHWHGASARARCVISLSAKPIKERQWSGSSLRPPRNIPLGRWSDDGQ